MKRILLIVCLFVVYSNIFATVITAKATAGWGSPTTWSPAQAPACGALVVIPSGFSVSVYGNYDLASGACASKPTAIIIYGELYFTNNNSLDLATGSAIYIEQGGTVASQNHGSNTFITVNGTTAWTGGNQGSTTGVATTTSISSGGIVQPIELLSFTADLKSDKVEINWQTVTETNNQYFTIEKSVDGSKFSELTKVNSAALKGNSTFLLSYQFIDENPLSGASYYRLKQTDYNGKFAYFNVVSVDNTQKRNIKFIVYPNPNLGEFTVNFSGIENNHEVQIILCDELGKEVYSTSVYSNSIDSHKVNLTPSTKISKGKYFCTLIVEGIRQTLPVLVN